MNKRNRIIIGILFVLSMVTCSRLLRYSEIKGVEFISVFVCGVFGGLLLAGFIKDRKDTNP